MSKINQTEKELLKHLREQYQFLISSSRSFDQGFEGEGKRLAVVIRVLLHDTTSSTSLLSLLNKKDIRFYDTGLDYDPRNLLSHQGLTRMRLGTSGAAYEARLDDLPPNIQVKRVSFDEWWNKIVLVDFRRNKFSRKDLVLSVANTDGGAHIDPRLDKAYADLSRFNSIGWNFFRNDVEEGFKNSPELPSIRQIAHELEKTLKDEFGDLLEA